MTKKKTFVQRFASQIRQIHQRPVVVCGVEDVISMVDVACLQEMTTREKNTIYLVSKNEYTSDFIEDSRACMIVYEGKLTVLSYHADPKFCLRPLSSTCIICCEDIKKESRGCSYCFVTYCIACQIKLIMDGYTKSDVYEFKCPYCTRVELMSLSPGYSLQDTYDNILWRIKHEHARGTISRHESNKLRTYHERARAATCS